MGIIISLFKTNPILEILSMNEYFKIDNKYEGDSGIDLPTAYDLVIPPNGDHKINFLISTRMKYNNKYCSYFLVPRSSTFGKYNLILTNSPGIIDAGYTGYICANVKNLSDKTISINAGTKLMQLVHPLLLPIKCRFVTVHNQTDRGGLGFGSTGH